MLQYYSRSTRLPITQGPNWYIPPKTLFSEGTPQQLKFSSVLPPNVENSVTPQRRILEQAGRKRVRLSCVSDATSPILHNIDARASNVRI
ncbi:hypothetical protein Y032_0081g1444 [Ancylostoma ceylanicum]|uniref:Uncharacterized protein n=1 Tax=Ancylostoma ceylanicum TaxID=53326 RepID=A0A016TS62_9BILA|nr:hypothetical protein Y032_0081g1444 [Ancylostoma ceylanicum]